MAGVGGWSQFHRFESVSPHYSSISCTGRELWLIDCQLTGYNFTHSCYSARASCNYYYLRMHACLHANVVHDSLKILIFATASPTRFQVTCDKSNLCTFSWQPPSAYTLSRRYGNTVYYGVSCTATGTKGNDQSIVYRRYTSQYNSRINLSLPYQFYNCCIVAMNEAGSGSPSCQTLITHEAGKLHTIMHISGNNMVIL